MDRLIHENMPRRDGVSFFQPAETIIPENNGGILHVSRVKKAGDLGRAIMDLSYMTREADPEAYDQSLGQKGAGQKFTFEDNGQLGVINSSDALKKDLFDLCFYFPDLPSLTNEKLILSLSHADSGATIAAPLEGQDFFFNIAQSIRDQEKLRDIKGTGEDEDVATAVHFTDENNKNQNKYSIALPLDSTLLSKLKINVTSSGGDIN